MSSVPARWRRRGRSLQAVRRTSSTAPRVHLENLLRLRQAGAVILFAAPGFYHGAETVDDLVDFVAGRALAQLGLDTTLVKEWGE